MRSAFDDVLVLKSQLWKRISLQGARDTPLQHQCVCVGGGGGGYVCMYVCVCVCVRAVLTQ